MDHKFTNDPSRLPAPPKSFFSLFCFVFCFLVFFCAGACQLIGQFRNTRYIPVAFLHGAEAYGTKTKEIIYSCLNRNAICLVP